MIKFYPTRKLSRCMQILLQTTPDNLTSFILGNMRTPSRKYINIHTYIHIYKYMFGSNFHGLAPERGLRRAFGPTNLLTSLRSGLRPSLREEKTNLHIAVVIVRNLQRRIEGAKIPQLDGINIPSLQPHRCERKEGLALS